ncbi:hypothetical protein [Niastella populi]|uniref:Uncharacterized protein n=1 Tax=Niastella populi TaxID=550983 RepID=A0A1V9FV44_9BACT|nr:hypothetical protein [Niastella populi]OQP62225.1 hypothetical protein A4R26_18285 [Niastella populi]
MSKLPKRHFWEWFKRNNKEYLDLNNKSKKERSYWLHELNAHLRAYYKFFEYSMALPEKGIARLTITVNGRAMHFKKVDLFVATAPEIPGWSITALEEPMPVEFLLEKQMGEAGVDPAEFSFSFDGNDTELAHVIVYHPLCGDDNAARFLELAYGALYNLLGERSFGLDLGHLEVDNLSNANRDNVYPIDELPTHIGWRKSPVVVGPDGTLEGMGK